jgi:Isocitrate/isopropylmalate dehydrogenase
MRQHRIAAIPADGIGPDAGLQVLEALAARDGGFTLAVDRYDWGSDYYRKHGRYIPADGLARLRNADAIYFGAVGAPDIPDDGISNLIHVGACEAIRLRSQGVMPVGGRRSLSNRETTKGRSVFIRIRSLGGLLRLLSTADQGAAAVHRTPRTALCRWRPGCDWCVIGQCEAR